MPRRGVDIPDVPLVRSCDANAEIRAIAKAHTQARVREACAAHTLHTVMIAMGISELCRGIVCDVEDEALCGVVWWMVCVVMMKRVTLCRDNDLGAEGAKALAPALGLLTGLEKLELG